MVDATQVQAGMEVVGADGVHVGVVDHMEDGRIKLKRKDPAHGQDDAVHHYLPLSAIASHEGGKLWLSSQAALADMFEEEAGDKPE